MSTTSPTLSGSIPVRKYVSLTGWTAEEKRQRRREQQVQWRRTHKEHIQQYQSSGTRYIIYGEAAFTKTPDSSSRG